MEATAIRGMILTSSERVASEISVPKSEKLRTEQHYETNLLLREIAAQLAGLVTTYEQLMQESNSRRNEEIARLRAHTIAVQPSSEQLQEQLEPLPEASNESANEPASENPSDTQ